MLSRAYKEGMTFYRQQQGPYRNPYATGSLEHNEFERGWSQALKRWPELSAKKKSPSGQKQEAVSEDRNKLADKKKEYLRSRGE